MTKLKYNLKSAFVQLFSSVTLGILTSASISPLQAQELPDSDPQQERAQFIQQANASFGAGNFTDAEKSLRLLLKKYPKDAFGHYQLGNVLYRQSKAEEAISEYQQAIRLNSSYALAHNALGVVLASKNQWVEATNEYHKALSINPDYGDALINLAQSLWQQGKKDEAIASTEKALNIFKQQSRPDKAHQVEQILQQMKTQNNPGVS